MNDFTNRKRTNTELSRESGHRGAFLVHLADPPNAFLSELCKAVLRTAFDNISAFLVAVNRIIRSCSSEQMFGVNAKRRVAFMQNAKTSFKWPVSHLKRKDMRLHRLALNFEVAVPAGTDSTSPEPATGRLRDISPEPLIRRPREMWVQGGAGVAVLPPSFVMGVAKGT